MTLLPAVPYSAPVAASLVPHLFAAQAARTPGAVALVYGEERVRYDEVERRAGRLAYALRRRGVGPGVRVGVCLERSPELVVSLLAVWKAGGAYLPLDPAYPRERLGFLLADAAPAVLLTHSALLPHLPAHAAEVLCVDAPDEASREEPPAPSARPDDLAYLIYTSGSTGTPKGVLVEHGSLAHTLAAVRETLGFAPGEVMPALASHAFDISLFELLAPLLSGGTVLLLPPHAVLDPAALGRALEGADALHAVPSLMRQVVDAAPAGGYARMRRVFVGGDAVPPGLLREMRRAFPSAEAWVLYGPTEATILSTAYAVPPEVPERRMLGRPLPGVVVQLRDAEGARSGDGEGELWVGGPGVARGYLGREALTEERYPEIAGERFYRTGDRARLLPDGTLEFLGRTDRQVKVRGFRIEPGEVEAALLCHPGVREAAVSAPEDAAGERRLVAYVAGEEADAEALRGWLGERLPAHLVPEAFVRLGALPLNAHGKVDRAALPAPVFGSGGAYTAPRTPVEEVLAEIFAGVLGVERVGVEDDFFHLGGHSLRAMRVLARVREAWGVELAAVAPFDAPTVAALAERVEALRAGGGEAQAAPVAPVPRDRPLPLSFPQRLLWFLHRMDPADPGYNMPFPLRLRGAVDPRALERALGELARRHEALRTVLAGEGDGAVQVVRPAEGLRLPVVELGGLAEREREREVLRLAAEDAVRPFDLERGPVLRATLVRLAGEDAALLLSLHHVAGDGWSMGVLFRELGALYGAFARGEPSPLAEPEVQYADWAVWQRARLAGEALERLLGWWREHLAGASPVLELPTDRPRPAVVSGRGAVHPFRLPAELCAGLRGVGRRQGATLYMVARAAFDALLSRYAGEEAVVVGTPVANRARPEAEGVVGCFVNSLAIRTDLSGDPPFHELLRRVREATLGAYAHQELPFERLVEEVAPGRSLSHTPLFQVMFALQNTPGEEEPLSLPGMRTGPLTPGAQTARFLGIRTALFDLEVELVESGGEVEGSVRYRTDLFDAATVERMAGHYRTLLEGVAAAPGERVSRLPLLGEAERRLLEAFGSGPAAAAGGGSVPERIAAQAARTPGAPAVRCGDEALTYAELEARAERVAARLRGAGVGPGVPVGVCVERGARVLEALLGVWKAGGVYLPLEPTYPAERLAFLLRDAGAGAVLTERALASALPEGPARVVLLDGPEAAGAEAAATGVDGEAAAYLIHTSGSTGEPKGVVVTHAQLAHTLGASLEVLGVGAEDVVAALASVAFDISLLELLAPLLSGGCVRILPRAQVLDPDALVAAVHDVTVLHAVPALMREVLEAARRSGGLGRVRLFLVGGDRVPAELPEALRAAFPAAAVHLLYGPTEGTIICATHAVEGPVRGHPLGRPLPGVRLRVCGARGEPVPVGVPGEILLLGPGVARGYLGRPEATAEKFVEVEGERGYRTADRARWRADGTLEFLGRSDGQVKLRGFRIEPGEVEAALREHPAVREAAVAVREDAGERRLVGYAVPAEGAAPTAAELREHLRGRLPEHMVPGALVLLDALPLTANGKVDRQALPAPEREEGGYVAPRTPAEEVLAGVWAEVLGVERVGAEDHFFDLGGHSLLAMRVVARVREAFGVELPVRALFAHPSLAELAAHVDLLLHGAGEEPELERLAGLSGEEAARDRTPRHEARPMSETADRLAQLSPERRLLLQKVLREKAGARAASAGIRPRAAGAPAPLSFAQQRLWFIEQLEPGTGRYNFAFPLRFRGRLDVEALRRTLAEIVRRHEVLRTRFPAEDGEPTQVVDAPVPVPLPVVELAGLAPAERDVCLRLLAEDELLRPFDLARGPLLRTVLLRMHAEEWVLLLGVHHIVYDGWSMGVLDGEIAALYAALSRGEPSPLAALPVQYADFAAWQRERLQGEELERQLGWWREHLAGAPPSLELPTDRPRPASPGTRGSVHTLAVPAAATRALRALARREEATLFMTVLAAWQLLLAKYSGEEDVVVGTPIAGRMRREVEPLIGFFANTLALRTRLGGDPRFVEVLRGVREATLGAYAHQELPFERLVEELGVERSLTHTPLFQVMLLVQEGEQGEVAVGDLVMEGLELGVEPALFDLLLRVLDEGDHLRCVLTCRDELWEPATVERMLEHFVRLLEGVASDPELPVSGVELLGPAERARVVEEWNATGAEYPRERCVHELFEAQAARTPEAVALVSGGERLTYAELEARANRLARHLRKKGVGPDARVGVCMERSAELMVSLLAILKAGGGYVPLDPRYPAERLALMIGDSGLEVLLTQARLAGALPAGAVRVVRVDADGEEIAREPGDPLRVPVHPENLAYVIYTSGSTGTPKGVAMPHGPLVNLLAWQEGAWRSPGPAVTLQFATISFDASFHEVFSCWSTGGRLVVAPEEARHDPRMLLELLERERVERLFIPYVALQHVAEEALARGLAPAALKEVQTAGEQLRVTEAIRGWFGALGIPLHNHYGPSETHVVTACALGGPAAEWPLLPSIGGPVANTRAYVLDAALGPAPVGVPGELYLGGECLARSYLNRPGPTAERFLPDPFSAEPGARMYRSGDRVRWLAGGTLEFLGRVDQQVKVRGFRIEPGEVEAALERLAGVREAVVVVRGEGAGRRLVAYAVPAEGARLSAGALRSGLQATLPEYMVPSAFVLLDRLPLTPSGKTDRRALPEPELTESAGPYRAPRTAVEEVLAEIWATVLEVERVGVEDNFFALGGHSLLATRMISRARALLGVELPLRALFEAQTVGELAARVEAERGAGGGAELPPLVRAERGGPLPLSFAQERLWFLQRLEPGSVAYNTPCFLRLRGVLDVEALGRALEALVERHEPLRTVFPEEEGGPVQRVEPFRGVPLAVEDVSAAVERAGEAEALERARAAALVPFDLAAGPLFTAKLLKLGEGDHLLVLGMHHVVFDGWSLDVLLRELEALYGAFRRGEPSPLPPLPVQYADYAVWQRGWLAGELLERQVSYWREHLSGAPPVLELPTDRPRTRATGGARGTHAFTLPDALSAELRALSRREGATPFMALLAGWQALLSRYSGQEEVVVGVPVAGRNRVEVEGLIGFFINTLVLRADLPAGLPVRALLAQARERVLDAQAHQDVPFARLVEELRVERSLTHTPIFQVTFNLASARGRVEPRLDGLEVEMPWSGEGEAPFDLALQFVEDGGRMVGVVDYRAELFDADTVERMAAHLRGLLEGMAASPGARVAEIPLLSADERARVIGEWSAAPAPECTLPVHLAVAEQAARTPGAAALEWAGGSVTYAELEESAGRLARHLRERGVARGDRVGLFFERTPELVVSVLAVLRAGGVYVPLDPGFPAERLSHALRDSGPCLLLGHSALRERLPAADAPVLLVDELPPGGEALPPVEVDPRDGAYVIYTSGSTGAPKGVLVEHGSLANTLHGAAGSFPLAPGAVMPSLASPAFDIWGFELFLPLLQGAAVRLLPPGQVRDVAALAAELERVDAVHAVPALMREVVRQVRAGPGTLPRVRRLFVGGDAVAPDLLEEVREAFPAAAVHVLYGPTEGTIICASHLLSAEGVRGQMIGRPLPGTALYVLDAGGNPLPVGVPGELCIGGAGVARGYLERPELTAEKWVPDPFGAPGARLYRTGDRARRDPDGALEFLGRVDQQVKIRGYRIEPGEVEAVLGSHPGVREAVVAVREDAGERRLVGYAVPAEGAAPTAAELREHLRMRLPEYMVPGALVLLDALPKTPTGKLDRSLLPAPEREEGAYVAPRTPTEEVLAGVWAEVLGVERVGAEDHFFELGGHSLLATRVVSRVRETFGVELPVRALFEHPGLAGLAECIDAAVLEGVGEDELAAELERLDALSDEDLIRLLEGA